MEALGLTWLPAYSAQSVANTQLMEIVVTDTNPERAAAVANELANQLIQQSPTNEEQDEQARQSFINQQLNTLEAKIVQTEDEVAEKQEELRSLFSARQIAETEAEIVALQNTLGSLQSTYAELLANT
jgi:uncharacterized protein involved in exopolysaccharide biosynthesis